MTSALLVQLLKSIGILAMLLMAGTFMRAKVPLFQKLLLPASVIAGFIGLLFGPNVLGAFTGGICLPFSEDYLTIWSLLPGILIVPIFASAPLGNGMDPSDKKTSIKEYGPSVLMMCGLFSMVGAFQNVLGYGTNMLFSKLMPNLGLYRTFGYELSQGYAGGHGTAAALGGILQDFGLEYWSESQGVGVTTATFGLLGGMIIGIILINRAGKRGQIANFGKKGGIPYELRKGIVTDVEKQYTNIRESTKTNCIDPITVHVGLILIGCFIAYFVRSSLSKCGVAVVEEIFSSVPVWFYALVMMYGVNGVLKRFKLNWMIERKIKSHITGSMSDIAITAAIVSCNVAAVMKYIVPILVMCLLGYILTYFLIFPITRKLFRDDYAFERAIISWGTNTGVMITGMMLLKICDPDYETPALTEFSMAFALMCIIGLPTNPIIYGFLAKASTGANFIMWLLDGLLYFALALVGYVLYRKSYRTDVTLSE